MPRLLDKLAEDKKGALRRKELTKSITALKTAAGEINIAGVDERPRETVYSQSAPSVRGGSRNRITTFPGGAEE
mgnify:CR=1 FL=1